MSDFGSGIVSIFPLFSYTFPVRSLFINIFFVEHLPGPASSDDWPDAGSAFTNCGLSLARARSGFWTGDMKSPFGERPARGECELPIAATLILARGKLCCQVNSGLISYRQEKILQFPPQISCRQEFHFWKCQGGGQSVRRFPRFGRFHPDQPSPRSH